MSKVWLMVLMLFAALSLSQPAEAFNSKGRCQIVRDAIYFAPQELQEYLVKHFNNVHKGIHHIDLAGKKSFDPYAATEIYRALIVNIGKGKLASYNTSHRFGVLAGYLAETVSPLEYRGLNDIIPGQVNHDGFQPVNDIQGSISRIIRNYRNPYLGQTGRQITDFLYNVAVNEIVDHWMMAWTSSGQQLSAIDSERCAITRQRIADKLRGIRTAGYVRDSSAFLPS